MTARKLTRDDAFAAGSNSGIKLTKREAEMIWASSLLAPFAASRVAELFRAAGLTYDDRDDQNLPGSPHFVFKKAKVVVFVCDDFVHGWQFSRWRHKTGAFWRKKIDGVIAQDKRDQSRLRFDGWKVVRVWTRQVTKNPLDILGRVKRALTARKVKR